MSTKLPQSVLILTLGCRRALNARHVSDQPGQRYITELRAKRGHPLIRSERKEEVFAALYHAREHGLSQRIAGIDEDVIGLEAIKLESKLNHFVRRCSAQRVAQVESTSGHLGGDRLRGRSAKKARGWRRSSTRPSVKQGAGAARKSRISWPLTASVGSRRVTVLMRSRPGQLAAPRAGSDRALRDRHQSAARCPRL